MLLTDAKIRGLRPKDKQYKVPDGGGLYLHVTPAGGKLWRFKYRFGGKEKSLSLGVYPDLKLADARKKHRQAREQLANGIDPATAKRMEKFRQEKTFETVASEWWHAKHEKWSQNHADLVWSRLEKNVLPWMKNRPISEITTRELLDVLRKIEKRGAVETARRVGQVCNQVFIYAVASGYTDVNVAGSLNQALRERKVKSFPAITEPKQVRDLLKAIDDFEGSFVVRQALRIAPLVFARPGELRKAEWENFDLDEGLWIIPADKMKMRRDHIVPLSRQAVEILQELEPLTGAGRYVFPSVRTSARPMSENTMNVALRRLGYSKEQMVSHGFRAMASTRLHELGWKTEVIEFQLAHADKNKIRGVYNRAEYLEERKRMMQAWADYLDGLKSGAAIIPMKRGG
jgi:integrase